MFLICRMLRLAHALTCLLTLPPHEPRRPAGSAAAVAAGVARGVARDPRAPTQGGPFASRQSDGDDEFWRELAGQVTVQHLKTAEQPLIAQGCQTSGPKNVQRRAR